MRELLVTHREAARAVGGRFGFVVGAEERVLDLDNGRVRGDSLSSAVQDDDDLDAVLRISEAAFADTLRGHKNDERGASEAYPGAIEPLLRFLAGVSR